MYARYIVSPPLRCGTVSGIDPPCLREADFPELAESTQRGYMDYAIELPAVFMR